MIHEVLQYRTTFFNIFTIISEFLMQNLSIKMSTLYRGKSK